MQTAYDTTIDQPTDAVWASLTDVDSVLAALPGAALARDDDGGVSGSVKCKLGSTQVTYRVKARAETGEAGFRTTVLTVTGTEARGSGTIAASLTVAVRADDDRSRVEVSGEVDATGRGEKADAAAWQRVVASMVNALIPPEAAEPEPAEAPRPPLAVAPPPAEPEWRAQVTLPRPVVFGLVAAALFILLRRIRRARTAK